MIMHLKSTFLTWSLVFIGQTNFKKSEATFLDIVGMFSANFLTILFLHST